MAHQEEPMDVDSEFDNKENTYHHSNVLSCTEKGYEELDVSEVSMKLRYSVTPISSPMSKSYTPQVDSKNIDIDLINGNNENANLTRSLNSTMTKNDNSVKTFKSLPLQALPAGQFVDGNGNPSMIRQTDNAVTDNANITVTVSCANDIYENLSLPSSSSSALHTPSTTPTKDLRSDGESPIMRGLKSVLNMFRSSQSPVPPSESNTVSQHALSPVNISASENDKAQASTPIAAHIAKDGNNSRRSSPLKDSIVFNDDLEKELSWKDETTIFFSGERIPVHKLFFQQPKPGTMPNKQETTLDREKENSNVVSDVRNMSVEDMDISYNDAIATDKTMTDIKCADSDNEFLDCETTLNKSESELIDDNMKEVNTNLLSLDSQRLHLTEELLSQKDPDQKIPDAVDSDVKSRLPNEDADKLEDKPIDHPKDATEIYSKQKELEAIQQITHTSENIPILYTTDLTCQTEISEEVEELLGKRKNVSVAAEEDNLSSKEQPDNTTHNLDIGNNIETSVFVSEAVPENKLDCDLVLSNIADISSMPIDSKITTDEKSFTNDQIAPDDKKIADNVSDKSTIESSFIGLHKQSDDLNHNDQDISKSQLEQPSEMDGPRSEFTNEFLIENTTNGFKNLSDNIVSCNTNPADTIKPADVALPNEDDIEIETKQMPTQRELVENVMTAEDNSIQNKLDVTFDKSIENDINVTTIVVEVPESQLEMSCETMTLNEETSAGNIHSRTETVQDMLGVQTKLNYDCLEDLNDGTSVQGICEVKTTIQDIALIQKLECDSETKIVNYDTPVIESILPTEPNYPSYDAEMFNIPVENVLEINETFQDMSTNQTKSDDVKLSHEEIAVKDVYDTTIMDVSMTQTRLDDKGDTEQLHKETVIVDSSVSSNISSKCESLLLTSEVTKNGISGEVHFDHSNKLMSTNSEVFVIKDKDSIETFNKSNNLDMSIVTSESEVTENIHTLSNKNLLEKVHQSDNHGILELSENAGDNMVNSNASDGNIGKDICENIQEKHTIEPVDITMNETLTQIHDLPDLVNQTVNIVDSIDNIVKELAMKQEDGEKVILSEINNESEIINITLPQQKEECERQNLEGNLTSLVIKENITSKLDSDNILPDVPVVTDIQTKIQSLKISLSDHNVNNIIESHVDEEIMVSENNSPYVSVTVASEEVEQNIEEPETTLDTTTNAPSSPPIKSRGYNFNFDDMDYPFGTKTQFENSPQTLTSSKQHEDRNGENINKSKNIAANKRKSNSSDRKKRTVGNKNKNSSFDVKRTSPLAVENVDSKPQFFADQNTSAAVVMKETLQDVCIREPMNINSSKTEVGENNIETKDNNDIYNIDDIENTELNKTSIESITSVSNDTKIMPSLDQSVYYSAGTSSTESFKSKNVFNLPEIEDINFNPFATKSKMRQSPLREFETDNQFATKSKILNSPATSMIMSPEEDANIIKSIESDKKPYVEKIDVTDKMETELMEKESTVNLSAATSSSMVTDNQNLTTREVNTEDEDTEEGPFLEADDGFDKILDYNHGDVDMMQFNEIPVQTNDDKMEGELFIDAEAFEFLLNQNKRNVVTDSGKESLFLKFDPLFAKRISSDGVLASLSKYKKNESTPTKPSRVSLENEASIAGPSTLNITYDGDHNDSQESNEEMNVTVSKPMMVVSPAVNPVVTPRTKPTTPTGSNRRSITFTSPAIAAIDRLLSMSSNNSFMGHDTTITQPRREQSEADLALVQLRELLAEKEISVYNLRTESKELRDRLATMESQIKILEEDSKQKLDKINELNERLAEKTKINKSMVAIVEEYEWTIASLIAETEQDKKRNAEERTRLINERDEQVSHLASMEVSFNDLHSKYEKSKQVIFACKANEEAYKKSLQDFEANLKKMQTNYDLLKQHATSKLNQANQELEKINKTNQAEVVKLNAMIKRKDLHITSLEETLAQKTKANEELTAICDELINKVG